MNRLLACLRWVLVLLAIEALYIVVTIVHSIVRGNADDAVGRTFTVAATERVLFFGAIPGEWLQSLADPVTTFPGDVTFIIWSTLFWLSPFAALVAYIRGGTRPALALIALHVAVIFSADAFYAIFPTRPPWLDTEVARMVAIKSGGATGLDTNPYAALPSLHVAVPAAYAVFFSRQGDLTPRWFHRALWAWVAIMSLAVVYAGEHYFLCAALGVLWAIACHSALERVSWRGMRPWACRDITASRSHVKQHATPTPLPQPPAQEQQLAA